MEPVILNGYTFIPKQMKIGDMDRTVEIFDILEGQGVNLVTLASSYVDAGFESIVEGILEHGRMFRVFFHSERMALLLEASFKPPEDVTDLKQWVSRHADTPEKAAIVIEKAITVFLGFFLDLSSARRITSEQWDLMIQSREEIGVIFKKLVASTAFFTNQSNST